MADLQEQLQTTLGASYTLERELGGGGMSRVFVAEEAALGRRVVVKVLPPEMAAGVNVDRFRREIQLAARLQHPHIVPVHAAGQAGDLFYYTMPLVEGESLRAKLSREGELPIHDAVRILRDVVDALAYAHAHGVVHRDIKPDNILIADRHAVVTDFGVAKAVSAASGESSLTSLGVALGTPAYMAPEQAAADPHVDHRADLYAVGCLAYEMLCGRPPFTGMPPQQILAAHVNQVPEPCTAHRATVPPALNALVVRCLEKKPADRPQRAADLLAELEAIATPSGGMAPTGATPALSSGAREAVRRLHPARVTVLFALASFGVLAVVYATMLRLGLPGWVFGGAVALLVVGLPIMLLAGRLERHRIVARTTGTTLPPAHPVARWLTWRRALAGGVLAFAGLGVVAAAYTAMRLLGIGPVATLIASGKLSARQRVLLADFESRAGDTTLGSTVTEAFRVDLSQSSAIKLMDASAIGDAMRRMERAPGERLTPALAREVAQREGVSAIVAGQIDPVGKGYVLSASVLSATDGTVLSAVRETAPDESALIPAIDRLSRSLRERIGESLRTIRANPPLERVTTSSVDALRLYTEADRLANAGEEERAIALLRQAVAVDTGFAMAYRKLGVLLGNTAAPFEEQASAIRHALAHRDRLPEMERYHTDAFNAFAIDYDPDKAIAGYRAVLQLDPNDGTALNNLALLMIDQRDYRAADTLLRRGLAAEGPVSVEYLNLIDAQILDRRPAAADSTLARFAAALPNDPSALASRGFLLASRFDYAGARAAFGQQDAKYGRAPLWHARASSNLSRIAEVEGRLAEAERLSDEARRADEERGSIGAYFDEIAAMAGIDARFRNRPAAAAARIAAALARHPLDSMPPVDRPYVGLVRAYTHAGQRDEAHRLLAEYERVVPAGVRRGEFQRHAVIGELALADGRPQDALTEFRAMRNEFGCGPCGLFEIGDAFQRSGNADSARVYYEQYLTTPGPRRVLGDAERLAAAYQRLGELYEARGDRTRAADYYGRLLDLWKNADPELQPIVRDVRARVAALSGPR